MRTFPKWVGALLLALLVVLPAAGCGGSGGGGGGGGGGNPCDITWFGNGSPVPLWGSVYLTAIVDGQPAKFSSVRVFDPTGAERLYENYVDPLVTDMELFSHLMPSHLSYGGDPNETFMLIDQVGLWRVETSTWSPGCMDMKRTTYFNVVNGPPPPPPPSDCEVGLGASADGSCTLGVRFHFDAYIDGRHLDLMNSAADRALVQQGILEFVQYQGSAYDTLPTNPNNGFCLDCYKTDSHLRWVRARGTLWCDGKWKEITGPWEPISDYIPGWPTP